ncbi:sugar uptake ABC transporter permease [Escherichia coli]|uniref:Sugar uptake ABC transporter permease n=1 Tax=Escherichia coli TaxID=562 RepID=A0A376LC62_ECOLX|nr:sugar uptake ABC transporter permease [Escherichia coli]
MTEKTLASPKPSEIPIANNFKKVFRQYGGILSGMVVLIILFSFINDSFFTANNITNIILQVSIIAITAYGMTYVLLLGDIDLSVGSTIALIGTFAALGASWGIPFILLVPLSIIAALALGMINGGLTAIAGIPSFIVTVATMGIFRGIAYIVTDGMPIMIKDDAFLALGNGEFLYIPIPIWILIILLLINHFILTKTTFGRKIYITGGNKEAAVYSGINVTRLKIKVFMIYSCAGRYQRDDPRLTPLFRATEFRVELRTGCYCCGCTGRHQPERRLWNRGGDGNRGINHRRY